MFADLTPPYATIVADPPWPYKSATGGSWAVPKPFADVTAGHRGVEDMGYSVMTMGDLKALPVKALAAPDAHLYVWTTNAFMVEAHELVRAWGFVPKTILTWVKTRQDDPATVSMKTGYYFRGATEHIVFGVRGSLPLSTDEGLPTAFMWPRIYSHSVKPDAFGDLVEQASPGPYVELFARRPRLGWDAWGKGYEVAS